MTHDFNTPFLAYVFLATNQINSPTISDPSTTPFTPPKPRLRPQNQTKTPGQDPDKGDLKKGDQAKKDAPTPPKPKPFVGSTIYSGHQETYW